MQICDPNFLLLSAIQKAIRCPPPKTNKQTKNQIWNSCCDLLLHKVGNKHRYQSRYFRMMDLCVHLFSGSSSYEGSSRQRVGCWDAQQQGQVFTAGCWWWWLHRLTGKTSVLFSSRNLTHWKREHLFSLLLHSEATRCEVMMWLLLSNKKQFKRSPPKIPYKAIALAVFLFLIGSLLIIFGALLLSGTIQVEVSLYTSDSRTVSTMCYFKDGISTKHTFISELQLLLIIIKISWVDSRQTNIWSEPELFPFFILSISDLTSKSFPTFWL